MHRVNIQNDLGFCFTAKDVAIILGPHVKDFRLGRYHKVRLLLAEALDLGTNDVVYLAGTGAAIK